MDIAIYKDLTNDLILVLLSALIGGLVSWILLRRDKAIDRQLLKETGAFRTPSMQMSFLGWVIGKDHPDSAKWYFLHPSNDNRPAIFNITLEINNVGDLRSEDNMLTVVAPRHFLPKDTEEGEVTVFPQAVSDMFKWSFDEHGIYGTATIIVSSIPPKTGVIIKLPLVIYPTSREESVDVVTKDGFPIQQKFRVIYQYAVSFYLNTSLGRDIYPLTIGAINASNISDAIMDTYESRLKKDSKSTLSTIVKDFIRLFTHTYELNINNFIEFEIREVVEAGGEKFYEMGTPPARKREIITDLEKKVEELSSWNLPPGTVVSVARTDPIPRRNRRRKE